MLANLGKWIIVLCTCLFFATNIYAQKNESGIITGSIYDTTDKPIENATVFLINKNDTAKRYQTLTEADGSFLFELIPLGFYTLKIFYINTLPLTIDSLNLRKERSNFNLRDIILKSKNNNTLEEVVVYAEKPLITSKDGNITFNVGESAVSDGSNASELLISTPLVTKDPDGKILVRGKGPKILIDDKPVQLNMQQLQDFLESIPGSSIEKIEVMTNPPPQYANEQGGVINISLKKGKLTKTGRIIFSTGTRGEEAVSGNFTYKKNRVSINASGGIGYSTYKSNSLSTRTNFYEDSSTSFITLSQNESHNLRPNARIALDYELSKTSNFSVALQYFQGGQHICGYTEFQNYNSKQQLYKLSSRMVQSKSNSYTPGITLGYIQKGKIPGSVLTITTNYNYNESKSTRDYLQSFLNADRSFTGKDSVSLQHSSYNINNLEFRVNYDRPVSKKKTFISTGGYLINNNNHTLSNASYYNKATSTYILIKPLLNDFIFNQYVINERISFKQIFAHKLSATLGTSYEQTRFHFTFNLTGTPVKNGYDTWLPFFNINKMWQNDLSVTLSFRRTIRRPGIIELNPTIDVTDPYNVRFGNPGLKPSASNNFNAVISKAKTAYFINLGLGYNSIENIFSQIRTLIDNNITQRTYKNISGRKEYEISTWNGYSLTKKIKTNFSTSYTYYKYSTRDKIINRYRDGASITSNLSITFVPSDLWNMAGSFTLNRFASPQGYARWNTSMNFSVMRRLMKKRLNISLNMIDPIVQQKNTTFIYGTNYNLQNYNKTRTRNFRINISYNVIKPPKKKANAVKKK